MNSTVRYQPGETLDFEDERAADLIERGLAVEVEDAPGHDDPGKLGDPGEPGIEPDADPGEPGKEPEADKEPVKQEKKVTKQKVK